MSNENKPVYYYVPTNQTYVYTTPVGNSFYDEYQKRKKQEIIQTFLNELHTTQLKYIDDAVDKSDLKEAKEVINYIKSKK